MYVFIGLPLFSVETGWDSTAILCTYPRNHPQNHTRNHPLQNWIHPYKWYCEFKLGFHDFVHSEIIISASIYWESDIRLNLEHHSYKFHTPMKTFFSWFSDGTYYSTDNWPWRGCARAPKSGRAELGVELTKAWSSGICRTLWCSQNKARNCFNYYTVFVVILTAC